MALLQSDNTKAAPAGYYYLWHLAALGVITADFGSSSGLIPPNNESALRITPSPVVSGSVWDTIAGVASISPARVALIDVGISPDHPNLATRIDQNASIDLATHRYGARALAILDDTNSTYMEEKPAFFAELDIPDSETSDYRLMTRNTWTILWRSMPVHMASCADPQFEHDVCSSRHRLCRFDRGRACRLAIGGRRSVSTGRHLYKSDSTGTHPNKNPNLLPYFGADPFSRLVNIPTRSKTMPYSSLPHSFMHIRRTLTSLSCHAAYPIRSEAPCSPRTN